MTTLDTFAAELDDWAEAVEPATDRALDVLAEKVADIQRSRTNVRTGATKRSIRVDRIGDGLEVGPQGSDATDVHQEFGGPRTPANPFVGPSADYAEAHIARDVAEEVEKTWR